MFTSNGDVFSLTLVLLTTLVALSGCVLLFFGKRLPRQGDWLAWSAVGAQLLVLAWGLSLAGQETVSEYFSGLGWIVIPEQKVAVLAGAVADPIGFVLPALTALVTLLLLSDRAILAASPGAERVYSASCWLVAGMSLAWLSGAVWTQLLGVLGVILSGFLAFLRTSNEETEHRGAIRYFFERSLGVTLVFLGGAALAAHGVGLDWASVSSWTQDSWPVTLATGALVLGVFLLVQRFPFLAIQVQPFPTPPIYQIVFGFVAPAWAAVAIIFRLDPWLHEGVVFAGLGGLAAVSAALTAIVGICSKSPQQALQLGVSAAFSLAFAVLSSAGGGAGFLCFVGAGLGAVIVGQVATFAAANEPGHRVSKGPKNQTDNRAKRRAAIAVGIAGVLSATGAAGFASAGGMIRWLAAGVSVGMAVGLGYSVSLFLVGVLWWRVLSEFSNFLGDVRAGWAKIVAPFFFVLLSLAVVWSGTLSGDVFSPSLDRVLENATLDLTGIAPGMEMSEDAWRSSAPYYWSVLVIVVAVGIWGLFRAGGAWRGPHRRFPKSVEFIGSGYGVVFFEQGMGRVFRVAGAWLEAAVGQRVWNQWVPATIGRSLRSCGRVAERADAVTSALLTSLLRISAEVPAKALQALHSGSVQWYLFFAIGFGFAILLNFLLR